MCKAIKTKGGSRGGGVGGWMNVQVFSLGIDAGGWKMDGWMDMEKRGLEGWRAGGLAGWHLCAIPKHRHTCLIARLPAGWLPSCSLRN